MDIDTKQCGGMSGSADDAVQAWMNYSYSSIIAATAAAKPAAKPQKKCAVCKAKVLAIMRRVNTCASCAYLFCAKHLDVASHDCARTPSPVRLPPKVVAAKIAHITRHASPRRRPPAAWSMLLLRPPPQQ